MTDLLTPSAPRRSDRYKWTALSNTTLGVFMASLDSSIVLISLPGIFTGIRLDPLRPANVSYLLWMLMGYMLVTAVLVVALGRLGDMLGRVRIYNAGFLIFTLTSVILSLDPFHGGSGALWLIGWRIAQAVGGSMLMANSAAILTDAFPARQRGMALGVNMVAGIAGSFLGLVLGEMIEGNFMTSMIKSDGDLLAFFQRPIAAVLGVITLLAWAWVLLDWIRQRNANRPAAATGA